MVVISTHGSLSCLSIVFLNKAYFDFVVKLIGIRRFFAENSAATDAVSSGIGSGVSAISPIRDAS